MPNDSSQINFGYMNLVVYSFQGETGNVITRQRKGTRVHVAVAGTVYPPGQLDVKHQVRELVSVSLLWPVSRL